MFLAENVIVSAIAFASHSATLNKLTLPALSLFGPPFCEQVLSTIWMKVFKVVFSPGTTSKAIFMVLAYMLLPA